jgi:hypothetical protein
MVPVGEDMRPGPDTGTSGDGGSQEHVNPREMTVMNRPNSPQFGQDRSGSFLPRPAAEVTDPEAIERYLTARL